MPSRRQFILGVGATALAAAAPSFPKSLTRGVAFTVTYVIENADGTLQVIAEHFSPEKFHRAPTLDREGYFEGITRVVDFCIRSEDAVELCPGQTIVIHDPQLEKME